MGIPTAIGGELAYDPGLVRASVAIIRGEWDSMCTDEDARWMFDPLKSSPMRRDIKIGRAMHLMRPEKNRHALYRGNADPPRGRARERADSNLTPRRESLTEKGDLHVRRNLRSRAEKGAVDEYLNLAKFLKPELEKIDGFIDNERFVSQRSQARILSLSCA
jgi:hypothetical protein